MNVDAIVAQVVARVKPYFLSSSYAQPPGASPSNTGNRTIAVTNQTKFASPKPTDTTVKTLTAGTVTWSFSVQFTSNPVISITPHGAPPSAGTTLYISSISANAVQISSTDATDARTLDLTATGNPV